PASRPQIVSRGTRRQTAQAGADTANFAFHVKHSDYGSVAESFTWNGHAFHLPKTESQREGASPFAVRIAAVLPHGRRTASNTDKPATRSPAAAPLRTARQSAGLPLAAH